MNYFPWSENECRMIQNKVKLKGVLIGYNYDEK